MGKWSPVSPHLGLVLMLVVLLGFHYVNGQETVPSPPINLRVTATTATSITVTWEHPGELLNGFELTYLYIINECDSNMRDPPVTVALSSSQNNYTIENGPNTPLEEDSRYSISLFAINSVGRSSSAGDFVTTPEAVPGIPEELQTVSVSVTNITIRWDRVNCRDRNGHTDSYRVVSYPTLSASPSDRIARTVVGTDDNDRMFSITGLPPRTNYTFEVQATNPNLDVSGSAAVRTESTTAPQDLFFLLDGQLYRNNSVVTVTDIGGSIGLGIYCLTPSLECCSDSETPNAASVTREWYLPDGTPVASDNSPFVINQVSSAVSLHNNQFSFNTAPSGVYRCEIPDASGTSQNIYVGIYPQGDGSPSITSLLFDRNSTTLTCTSTGGPPTTVTWRKDGQVINQTLYEQSQRLVDAERAIYENILFDDDVASFVGSFTCEVSNVRDMTRETTVLNGVSIIRDQLNIGASATATCFSDVPATRMEWLQNGVVIASDTSTQQLDLEFSPVSDSIDNQVYICRVTRQGGAQAEQDFTAIVDVPPNAITATVSRSGTATAGMVYSLTCNVSKTVGGLTNTPTAMWTTGGEAVTNRNGITVTDTTGDTTVTSTLTFDPLRTSHDGSFVCSGTLTSPALDTALMPSITEDLEIQISTPDVVMTVPSGPLFAGRIAPLTLTCTISINSATDTDIEISDMDITWLRGSTRLSNDDSRVTISSVTGSRPSFTSTLTLDPLSTADNTTFTCQARARPPTGVASFITASETGEDTELIVVNIPSPPTVSIDPFNRLEMAGQPLTLNCSASIQEGIRGTPVLTWTREDASLSSDVTSAPPLLSFHSLRTSHAGRYTCTARLNIPEAGVDISGDRTTTVLVEIPLPLVTISSSPGDNMTFFIGLSPTFTCIVEIYPAVDTPVMVRGYWERNGTQLQDGDDVRISVNNNFASTSSNMFQITIRISSMSFGDAGTYSCSAIVTLSDNFVIVPRSSAENQRPITVQDLPAPDVDVESRQSPADGCGEARILNCTTSLGEGFGLSPTIVWIGPDDSAVSTDGNPRINTESNQLIFSDIIAVNSGTYKCRVSIGNDIEAVTAVIAGTTLPGEVGNLVCAVSSSATEFSFSWNLPTLLGSEVVSYQVTVNRLEHRPGTREVTQSAADEQFVYRREASIVGLAAEVPYSVTVKAINLAGCGEESETYCFTREGVPPPPENVVFVRFNPTSIGVSWNKFTLVELKGLANYIVTYTIIIDSRKRQSELGGTVTVPWTQNRVIVTGLQSGAEYDVTVRTSTAAGMSAPVRPGNIATPSPQTAAPSDTASSASSSDNTSAIIGGVVAVMIVLIIAATTAIIVITVALILRNRRSQFSPNQKSLPYKVPGSVMLSDLSPTTNKVYETIEADHEYEILDEYSQPQYDDVKVPPPAEPKPEVQLQPSGDYQFTQCPAYVPMATVTTTATTSDDKRETVPETPASPAQENQ